MPRARTMMLALVLSIGASLPVAAQETTDYAEAWERLQSLSGSWNDLMEGSDEPVLITYHLTSGGSVLFEEFVGDHPDGVRDMASTYHMDLDEIVATHYCGAGNQPRFRAVQYDPELRTLRFDFWDITHLASPDDYYTTGIEFVFQDDDHVELRFSGVENGEPTGVQVHRLTRLSTRPTENTEDEVEAGQA